MDALIPLLLIFIALNSKQLAKDKLYRANVFAVVGIFYFVFLQYIHYWNRIFQVDGWVRIIPILIIVLVAVGLSLSPFIKRSHIVKTTILCSIFAASLATTYIFDISVKEWLAEKGGFYSDRLAVPIDSSRSDRESSFKFHAVGLEMRAFDRWSKVELPSGHEYLKYEHDGEGRVEVRPNCLGKIQIDTPTYVSRILQSAEPGIREASSSYECGKYAGLKECLVKVTYSSEVGSCKRWHLYAENDSNSGVVVDFILSGESELLQERVMSLMASIRIIEKRTTEVCRTPAVWL